LYKRHATTDELTGLYNRRWMQNLLRRHLLRSSMNRQRLAVLMVDVDRLKEFNADFGRAAGDHALFAVAQTLSHSVRPGDAVARFGGGQFLVLLPGTDLAGARVAAERVRAEVAEAVVMMSDESILPSVTVSVGMAQMSPFSSPESLLADAGAALERAKAAGRNCLSD
jgi:diguanylate cyclase (GGDEF)-like protein